MISLSSIAIYLAQNPILSLTVFAHLLSDFHLQSQEMADKKVKRGKYLYWHYLGIAIPLIILSFVLYDYKIYFLTVFISHVVIDYLKCYLDNIIKRKKAESLAFIIDQLLHLLSIIILYHSFSFSYAPDYLTTYYPLIQISLFLILITKPVNIAFKIIFKKYQVSEDDDNTKKTIAGAGGIIGNLERLAIGLFLIVGQITAIGFIFTAKSIARYDKIAKNQAFAEYYLIGSLFSIISVIIAFVVIYGWFGL
ncbi:DUF3307 domain-containing protein [Streptococcus zalophi]|uniref:DUF3307 domain-containing protein n=1 Tax=Streptococcus zalophi TaxID=640031 RepID=A0A934P9J2_9STRE|nr:DUF3307 domain-containing protein [Streptococcus zalophi]MBJ8349468.1 DUF3307 domain-containing protein [Streptococcus zalophi]MCR8967337.1 DUF3307 domain-containing protein [Streptococcus zalophi]